MHGLLLLRNVHDYGGADMPVIIVDWQTPILEAALDYWVEASKNQWSETERAKQCVYISTSISRLLIVSCPVCQVASMHPGLNPCLYQVDRCVRSLLRGDDPDVGYVAPVIAFYQFHKNGIGLLSSTPHLYAHSEFRQMLPSLYARLSCLSWTSEFPYNMRSGPVRGT